MERSIRPRHLTKEENVMTKPTNVLVIALAAALMVTAADAERSSLDDVQAPRGQAVQAPHDRTDDVEAPRGPGV
jgi:hypothetical protein